MSAPHEDACAFLQGRRCNTLIQLASWMPAGRLVVSLLAGYTGGRCSILRRRYGIYQPLSQVDALRSQSGIHSLRTSNRRAAVRTITVTPPEKDAGSESALCRAIGGVISYPSCRDTKILKKLASSAKKRGGLYRNVGPDLPSPSRDGAGETEVIKPSCSGTLNFSFNLDTAVTLAPYDQQALDGGCPPQLQGVPQHLLEADLRKIPVASI